MFEQDTQYKLGINEEPYLDTAVTDVPDSFHGNYDSSITKRGVHTRKVLRCQHIPLENMRNLRSYGQ